MFTNSSIEDRTICLKSGLKSSKKNKEIKKKIVFHMICGLLQGKYLTTCGNLILQGFLTFYEYQLGNDPYFTKIPYATTIFIIQGYLSRF